MTDPIKWFISILLGSARTRAIDERGKTGGKKKNVEGREGGVGRMRREEKEKEALEQILSGFGGFDYGGL